MTVLSTDNAAPAVYLVKIPSRPSIRSAASTASIDSSSSSSSSSSSFSSSSHTDKPVDNVIYRHGRIEDAPFMTDMQFSNYLFHYQSITPRAFLDAMDYPAMTEYHAKRMTPPVDEREMAYVVAERINEKTNEPEVIGMSQVTAPYWDRGYDHRFQHGLSQEDFDCEIDTLYVKIGVQGGGIGRKLVLGALQEGYDRFNMRRSVIIWTLEGNTQGREFYKRIGCQEFARRKLDLAGVPCECVGYGFRTVAEGLGK